MAIGIDFGTTNSVLAFCSEETVNVQKFATPEGTSENYRSVLFFPSDQPVSATTAVTGPAALEAYHEHAAQGRLLQSLKSFLCSSFESTRIGSQRFTLEKLISLIIEGLLKNIPSSLNLEREQIVVGRPVRFVNAETEEHNKQAESRLRQAFALAGLKNIRFELEPVAAAFSYEQNLAKEQLLLVGDFGGGTSDFTLMRVGPQARKLTAEQRILGTSGLGIAGDAFDSAIVTNRVIQYFGHGQKYSAANGVELEIPHWLYAHASNWYQLAMLKDPKVLRQLHEMSLLSDYKTQESLHWFSELIDQNLSYYLYQSVAESKSALSSLPSVNFEFKQDPIYIEEKILRRDFEKWISGQLARLRECVVRLLAQSQITETAVDRVFLTGGSAFVPAVRTLFADIFGAEKVSGGKEFTSVASGLALCANAQQ